MLTIHDPRLEAFLTERPQDFIMASVVGSHIYGFESPNSDLDVRAIHLAPIRKVLGLGSLSQEPQRSLQLEDFELDFTSYEIEHFLKSLTGKNGNFLEQLYSPMVLASSPRSQRLQELGMGVLTRHHIHHYRGLASSHWKRVETDNPIRAKSVLHAYRALLTGLHLLESGELETQLRVLAERYCDWPFLSDLIEAKRADSKACLPESEAQRTLHKAHYEALLARIADAEQKTALPDKAQGLEALNDFLIELRLSQMKSLESA